MNRVQNISLLFFLMLFVSLPRSAYAGSATNKSVFVKKINLAGNLILDDADLEIALDLGENGIHLTPDLLPLIAEEVEGFYSSQGFHQVRAIVPLAKSPHGVLSIDVDEKREIREGQSDTQRAKVAIDRLTSRNKLELVEASTINAVATLVKAYQRKRTSVLKAEKKLLKAEKALAKTHRNRYLAILKDRQKAASENLKLRREGLLNIFTNQKKFFDKQKAEETERITNMRRRMQTILDTKFNQD